MPSGIILFRWDNQNGPLLVKTFPETLKITSNLMAKVYYSHHESSNPAVYASLRLKYSKVFSFFSGAAEGNYVVALILRRDENINSYRDILDKAAADLLKKTTGPKT